MELKLKKNSPITVVTVVREFDQSKLEANHSVRWVPKPNCPDGYIIQYIKRDTKITNGRVDPKGGYSWDKNPTKVERGEYFELWEVINGGVYPCKTAGGILFSTGDVYAAEEGVPAGYVRGNGVAAYATRPLYHDNFGIKPDGGKIFKGTAKILGEVYFIPKTKGDQLAWMVDFKKNAKRRTKHGVFWGGILLTRAKTDVKTLSSDFNVMTRYEAAEFIQMAETDRRLGKDKNDRTEPQTRETYSRYIGDRGFPGFGRKSGQGIVNVRHQGTTGGHGYTAGSNAGPAGSTHKVQQMKTKGKTPGGLHVDQGDWYGTG